jgi:hypothetical protein
MIVVVGRALVLLRFSVRIVVAVSMHNAVVIVLVQMVASSMLKLTGSAARVVVRYVTVVMRVYDRRMLVPMLSVVDDLLLEHGSALSHVTLLLTSCGASRRI